MLAEKPLEYWMPACAGMTTEKGAHRSQFSQNETECGPMERRDTMTRPPRTAPFAPFEWLLSARYLRARRKEGFISVIAGFSFLGIMLGVATLIIVMAVLNGFRKELLDKILGLNGHLVVQPLESPLTDWKDVAERIGQMQGIRLAVPVLDGPALASASGAAGVLVRGIRANDLNKLSAIAGNIKHGSIEHFDQGQGVAIGQRLADQLSLHAGDAMTLVAQRGAVTPMGVLPRIKQYKVAAIFEIGMSEYDTGIVLMPIADAQAFFNRNNDVTAIEVFTSDPDRIDLFRKQVVEAAGRPVFLVDWRRRNSTFFDALEVQRNVMFLILTLIVVVAALNIVSGLIMLVKDKGSDIAILRTMGASQGSIMRIFLIAGASIGVAGALVGFVVGLIICRNIEAIRQFLSWLTNTELFPQQLYLLSRLPADIDAGETAAVVMMALALSFLATLYPSWRAARLDPVDVLRHGG
jgi:lipoprotein-releasing system permease protein